MRPSARIAALALATYLGCPGGPAGAEPQAYRSPRSLAVSPDGATLYVSDPTAGCVAVLAAEGGEVLAEIPLSGEPHGLALSADGGTLFVAQRTAHRVAVIDTAERRVARRLEAGPWPVAVALCPTSGRLAVCNRGDHTVSIIDASSGAALGRVPAVREPFSAAFAPDGRRLVVANLLPLGAGTDPELAAAVTLIDAESYSPLAAVALPPGSTNVTAVSASPCGRWAYVVHAIGRFNLPITHLERGWVHTYALSIVDVERGARLATVLLDEMTAGAADPWDLVVSADGERLWIAHAGVHEVSRVELGRLHALLEGEVPEEIAGIEDALRENTWVQIREDPSRIGRLSDDLTALSLAGLIARFPSGGDGPRGLALSPDGARLYVANYYAGTVGVLDAAEGRLLATHPVGPQAAADSARRGEIHFHDATACFQRWHSCASCHFEGRIDGLPWNFLSDGVGTANDTISLVWMGETSPHNRRGNRADPRECMRTGVIGSHMVVPSAEEVDDLLAYALSLEPEANPAVDAASAAVLRGKALFEGKAECAECHPAPLFTDNELHAVGSGAPRFPDDQFVTPTLVELFRTAPYLHDGRALTLHDAWRVHDPENLHGNVRALTDAELDDLVLYLLSL